MIGLEKERRQFIKDESKYERMSELSRLLHIPVIYSIWRLKVGKDGIYHTEREFYANSWVRNAYNVHADQSMGGKILGDDYEDGSLVLKQLSGINYSLGYSNNAAAELFGYAGSVGDDEAGIVIGTGTVAETLTTFELDALVAEGTMDYQVCALDSKGWNAGGLFHWSIWTRDIDNNSGDTITITELGMISNAMASRTLLFIRDLLASSQAVPDNDTLTVELELRQPFPS